MNNSTKIKSDAGADTETQNINLQDSRASILEKHLNKQKEEKSPIKSNSEKELEIKKIKEEIEKIKGAEATPPVVQIQNQEYAQLVNKILFEFRNEINSPINSIEYSTENLKSEYNKLINNFTILSASAYPAEALERAFNYANVMMSEPVQEVADATLIRDRKKKFAALLAEYNILNSNRAAEYFVSAGIFYIDAELFWILSQPKAEVLFEIIISLLSINQSFEILHSAKSRTRFLTANLIIPSDKEINNRAQETISEEEKKGDTILKRKFISDEIIPVIKMAIILLNLFAIFKMLFYF